jgi:hypothetical protein
MMSQLRRHLEKLMRVARPYHHLLTTRGLKSVNGGTPGDFKKEFKELQLAQPRAMGGPSVNQYRAKFIKHFQIPRDYNIYTSAKLCNVAASMGLELASKANKKHYIEALEQYDRDNQHPNSDDDVVEGFVCPASKRRRGDDDGSGINKRKRL